MKKEGGEDALSNREIENRRKIGVAAMLAMFSQRWEKELKRKWARRRVGEGRRLFQIAKSKIAMTTV